MEYVNNSGKLLAGIISTQLKLHEGMEDQSKKKMQGTIFKHGKKQTKQNVLWLSVLH